MTLNNFLFTIKPILKFPKITLGICLLLLIIGAFFAIRLPIDASPDSLLLENDKDFEIYQQTIKNYGERNFLILSFNPKDEDIFSADSLQTLKRITQDLQEIPQIQSTLSILNAPLLKSSHSLSLQESLTLNLTLLSPQTDLELAKEELSNHPFYRQNLLSINKKNAGILIYLKDDSILQNLRNNIKNATNTKEKRELQKLLRKTKQQIQAQDTQTINAIKALKTKYEGLYIGGITLIASDMITYIKSDLITYGTFLSIILGFMLWLFFKQSYFVFLTLFICFYNLIISSGIFSLFGYEITVVSSNYASLMLIINVSLIIHLLVAYCEFYEKFPKASQKNLIYAVILSKKKPSFYATLTTIIGFLSLIFSNILPIIHLGIIMSLGISITLLSSFILFGVLMYLVPKPNSLKNLPKWHHRILSICANLSLNKPKTIYAITLLVFIFSLYGITQLKIENSFVNYFKDSSEIKQGLLAIDKNLGGTIALDILVTFHEEVSQALGELSDFEEEFNTLGQQDAYWFDSQKLRIAKIIHNYLQNQDFIGSVLSLHSLSLLLESLNLEANDFMFAFLYQNMSKETKMQLFSPYANKDKNQIRFVARTFDSNPKLERNAFLTKIKEDLNNLLKNESITLQINGAMVLYNNLLQTLVASQVGTLSFVILTIFLVFILLFRSIKLSIIALLTNLIPLGVIFGILGLAKIPLDLMGITIASIALGIGVDDVIHYIDRYKEELKKTQDFKNAILRSHQSVGNAMYYTTFIIAVGFGIMMSSNFTPTIYFGFLTTLVMLCMLLSSLILLPTLLNTFYATYKNLKNEK